LTSSLGVADPSTIHRRQQRRRAIIAWGTAALVTALIALGAIFGGEEEDRGEDQHDVFGYAITTEQYDSLQKGLDESDLVDRLQQTGLPEDLTSPRVVLLFPPHPDDVLCSFWEISDRPEYVARICFSDPEAKLVQKLQRSASDQGFGVSV
jgi:hypothetical protein